MRPTRALSFALLLSACSPATPAHDAAYFTNLPLDANGLPPHFTRCVLNRTEKETQVYDIYYPCSPNLGAYVARINGMDPTQKGELLEQLEKRGMKHAHEMAVARWGEKSRPPLSTVKAAPPPAAAKPTPPPSEPIIVWGPSMPAPPSKELRF